MLLWIWCNGNCKGWKSLEWMELQASSWDVKKLIFLFLKVEVVRVESKTARCLCLDATNLLVELYSSVIVAWCHDAFLINVFYLQCFECVKALVSIVIDYSFGPKDGKSRMSLCKNCRCLGKVVPWFDIFWGVVNWHIERTRMKS